MKCKTQFSLVKSAKQYTNTEISVRFDGEKIKKQKHVYNKENAVRHDFNDLKCDVPIFCHVIWNVMYFLVEKIASRIAMFKATKFYCLIKLPVQNLYIGKRQKSVNSTRETV